MKDIIKKATDLAENEIQEKEIDNFKKVIKDLLTKLKDKEKDKEDIMRDIKLIKQDIDDFKAGRLDKIKERHEIDDRADRIYPINITIINQNNRPTQPWTWQYRITPVYTPNYYGGGLVTTGYSGTTTLTNAVIATSGVTGSSGTGGSFATFTSGTYDVGGDIISL